MQQRAVRIEAVLAQALGRGQRVGPVANAAGQRINLVGRHAQHPRHIAHCTGAAIAAGHRGERGAAAAVALEHVLDHFLAPLVLEVDVDVRRLVALTGDEAFEQHPDPVRVDRGDSQRVADHRVGGRAAALTEDLPAAGKAHDVVHGEEVALVAELGDQRQLFFHQRTRLLRHAARPAPAHAFFGELAQPRSGTMAGGHQLVRILVAEFAQVEAAATGNAPAFFQQRRGIQRCQRGDRTQMALAVGEQSPAGLGHGNVVADGGHHVLQRAPPACVHVHVASGYQWQAKAFTQRLQPGKPRRIVCVAVQFHRDPQPVREQRAQPVRFLLYSGAGRRTCSNAIRQPQRQQSAHALIEVLPQQPVLALGRPHPRGGDDPAQRLVAGQVLGQQHQLRPAFHPHLAAGDQRQTHRLRRLPGAHDPGQGALVGDRQCFVAMLLRALEQFVRARGPALEAEVRQAVQLGVARAHANHPCSHQSPPRTGW